MVSFPFAKPASPTRELRNKEHQFRERLVASMVDDLGYPKGLLVVEKELKQVASVSDIVPKRRIDLLAFDLQLHPLLLLECKAGPFHRKALLQVAGYNLFIKAPMMCIASPGVFLLGWKEVKETKYEWRKTLPTFEEVLHWKDR